VPLGDRRCPVAELLADVGERDSSREKMRSVGVAEILDPTVPDLRALPAAEIRPLAAAEVVGVDRTVTRQLSLDRVGR